MHISYIPAGYVTYKLLIMAVISLTFPHNPLKTCGNSIFPFSFSYLENIAMSVFTSCVLIPGLTQA